MLGCHQGLHCSIADRLMPNCSHCHCRAGKFKTSISMPEHSDRLESCDIQLHDALLTCTAMSVQSVWQCRYAGSDLMAVWLQYQSHP